MKFLLIVFFFITLGFSQALKSQAPEIEPLLRYPDGSFRYVRVYKNIDDNQKLFKEKWYYDSGQVSIEYEFETGKFIEYYRSGKKSIEGYYVNIKHEDWISHFQEWIIELEQGDYEQDYQILNAVEDWITKKTTKDGSWVFYYEESGKIKRKEEYSKGDKVGTWLYYLSDEKNSVWQKEIYKNKRIYQETSIGKRRMHRWAHGDCDAFEQYTYHKNKITFVCFENKDIGQITERFDNGEEWKLYYKNGKINLAKTYYINGHLKEEIKHVNGKLDVINKWDESGNFLIKNSLKHGEWTYKYGNGQIRKIGKYDNGNKIGLWIDYNEDNQIKEKANYVNGELINLTSYFDGEKEKFEKYDNGKVTEKGVYDWNGKRRKWTYYDDDNKIYRMDEYEHGNLSSETYYKDDIKHGAFYNYISSYDKGVLRQGNYKNGELHGDYFEYWPDGSILMKKNYIDGKEDGKSYKYYDNGNVWWEKNFKNEMLDKQYIEYYENGQIKIEGNYKDGKKHGKFIKYYEVDDTTIQKYIIEKFGQNLSLQNTTMFGPLDKARKLGQIETEESYKDGKKDGEKFIEYYENGFIKKEESFKNGKKHGKSIIGHINRNDVTFREIEYKFDECLNTSIINRIIRYDHNGKLIEDKTFPEIQKQLKKSSSDFRYKGMINNRAMIDYKDSIGNVNTFIGGIGQKISKTNFHIDYIDKDLAIIQTRDYKYDEEKRMHLVATHSEILYIESLNYVKKCY